MNYAIVVLTSITAAKRVERIAGRYGITVCTKHTPKIISPSGCSHSVRVKETRLQDVLKICADLKLSIRGVYREVQTEGQTQYFPEV